MRVAQFSREGALTILIGCGAGYWPRQDAGRFVVTAGVRVRDGGEGHVDVFEDGSGVNAGDTVGGLDEVIAGGSGLFTAEGIGEDEWFGELTGAHQKTSAVDGPWALGVHSS
ncbi:MAG TPA: hypothetical protein VJK27_12480 [Terriglobales bacterium]|nr:hypothetical protein [Terriglobales bacterium]